MVALEKVLLAERERSLDRSVFSAEGTFILNGKGDGLGVMTGGSVERGGGD